ncbi:hypothetical protein J6590_058493 [Homalodisca vitripennis]|nr:hypothetical protein J6590_058493 [Homalodisca vitripennis]
MPLYDFRLEVIDKLLPDVPKPPRPLKRRRVPHVPSRITEKVACGKRSKQKRCRVCYANGRKKYVMWQCLECDGQPGFGLFFKNNKENGARFEERLAPGACAVDLLHVFKMAKFGSFGV